MVAIGEDRHTQQAGEDYDKGDAHFQHRADQCAVLRQRRFLATIMRCTCKKSVHQ